MRLLSFILVSLLLLGACAKPDTAKNLKAPDNSSAPVDPREVFLYVRGLCASADKSVTIKVTSPLDELESLNIEVKVDGETVSNEPATSAETETVLTIQSANNTLIVDLVTDSGVRHKFLSELQILGEPTPRSVLCRTL